MALYVNGELDGQPVQVSGLQTDEHTTIGFSKQKGQYSNGDMGRIRMLQRAMAASEVQVEYQLFRATFP